MKWKAVNRKFWESEKNLKNYYQDLLFKRAISKIIYLYTNYNLHIFTKATILKCYNVQQKICHDPKNSEKNSPAEAENIIFQEGSKHINF